MAYNRKVLQHITTNQEEIMKPNACQNFNHRRSDAPVRFCPQCGTVVNSRVPTKRCSEASHDYSRRNHNLFCVDCGEVLRRG